MKDWISWLWDLIYMTVLFFFVVLPFSFGAQPDDNEALMSWAVLLSGYPAPDKMPNTMLVKHQFLERSACGNKPCGVLAWFDGKQTIYLDDRLNLDNTADKSIVVHEDMHYLQHSSGKFGASCQDAMKQEREAYAVQQEFLVRHGIYYLVGTGIHFSGCDMPDAM